MESPDFNPYQAPQTTEPEAWLNEAADPVPWEDKARLPGAWPRIKAMLVLFFTKPSELAERIPNTDGIGAPWAFYLLMSLPYIAFMGLIFAFMGSLFFLMVPRDQTGPPRGFFAGMMGAEFVLFVLVQLGFVFVAALIVHFLLWLFRGLPAGRGLGQSMRATLYVWGITSLGAWIPGLNMFVILGGMVMLGIVLAKVHRTEVWRGLCAVFSPLLFCCCGYIAIFVAAFSSAAMQR